MQRKTLAYFLMKNKKYYCQPAFHLLIYFAQCRSSCITNNSLKSQINYSFWTANVSPTEIMWDALSMTSGQSARICRRVAKPIFPKARKIPQQTLTQRWFIVGPPSTTLAQQ